MGEAKVKKAKRAVQGWMALAMFGCHCGERAPGQTYVGNWICTHLRSAHPELLLHERFSREHVEFIIR